MSALKENIHIQFLSLAGNKLTKSQNVDQSEYIKKFHDKLCLFFEHNTSNLTHLDLSDMMSFSGTPCLPIKDCDFPLDIERILTAITHN